MKQSANFVKYFFSAVMIVFQINCKEIKTEKKLEEPITMKNEVSISKSDYGITADGQKVEQYQMENQNGISLNIITYGGRITYLKVPDNKGVFKNIVLGFDSLEQYEKQNPFFGALIGRYGNRIGKGKFTLEGTEYNLATNNGENNLHGGLKGFDKVVWTVEEITEGDSASLKLSYLSSDMEEGFPGNLKAVVTYVLNSDNSLDVYYEATTDKTTVVNLTQHAYFNLSGDFSTTILDHMLQIDADSYVPVDSGLIPTGDLATVDDTPFDFRVPKVIGEDINAENTQIELGGGYDHCWVLNDQKNGLRKVAVVNHPNSGRVMEVSTTEPGIQFYSGNFLDGTLPSPNDGSYASRSGLCLETQHYPDSPNKPQFPSTILKPGQIYRSQTTFTFSTK